MNSCDSIPLYKTLATPFLQSLSFSISVENECIGEWMVLSFASPHNSMLSLSWLSGFLSWTCSQLALFLILSTRRSVSLQCAFLSEEISIAILQQCRCVCVFFSTVRMNNREVSRWRTVFDSKTLIIKAALFILMII